MLKRIIQGFIQLSFFTIIPLIYYMISHKKLVGFFNWVGIKAININSELFTYMLLVLIVMSVISILPLIYLRNKGHLTDDKLYINNFVNNKMGFALIVEVLIYSTIITAFGEEIFFRGFLVKVLIAPFGFIVGNMIHSVIFGLIHGLPLMKYGKKIVIVVSVLPTVSAYLLSWNNLMNASGSIIPSIIIHSTVNFVSAFIIMKIVKKDK